MYFEDFIFCIFNIDNNDAMISKQSMVLRQNRVAVTLIHFEKRFPVFQTSLRLHDVTSSLVTK